MDKLILGRYIPGNSVIHRLDPRSKLVAMFFFILLIFWANNLITNLLLFVFVFTLIFLSKVPLTFFLKGIQSMVFIIAFTTLFQLFLTGEARYFSNLVSLKLQNLVFLKRGLSLAVLF